jgi:hypothetical protein
MLNFDVKQIRNSQQYVLLKKNIVYIVAIIFFAFIGIYFLPQQVLDYTSLRQKNNDLQQEISKQEKRLQLIESINVQDLNQLLLILNTLYPQEEDQFSIYPVIDNLQAVTGMLFIKKSSPFGADPKAQLSITIDAVGTLDQVKVLLRDYPFKSARILTINSLTMRPNKTNPQLWDVQFAILFHVKEITAGTGAIDKIDPMAIAFARQARDYFLSRGATYTKISIKDEDIPLNYSTKKNPFQ